MMDNKKLNEEQKELLNQALHISFKLIEKSYVIIKKGIQSNREKKSIILELSTKNNNELRELVINSNLRKEKDKEILDEYENELGKKFSKMTTRSPFLTAIEIESKILDKKRIFSKKLFEKSKKIFLKGACAEEILEKRSNKIKEDLDNSYKNLIKKLQECRKELDVLEKIEKKRK